MQFNGWHIVLFGVGYVAALFAIASFADARARRSGLSHRPRPFIYALSLGVYCTSWTYFGSVGIAARSGLDFIPVYLGPILVFALATPLLIRITDIAKRQNISSIADFIAARYGKNQLLGGLVALVAVIGIVPYISIQLRALAFSLETMLAQSTATNTTGFDIALFATIALAIFTVLFGTRHTDTTEHQHGLMAAIATESVVKLFAFLAIGIFVTFWLADGVSGLWNLSINGRPVIDQINVAPSGARWLTVTLISALAIMLLPRQFHVSVVENAHHDEIRRARWLFPLYLIAINIFVLPIAIVGLAKLPGVDADTFVLALPAAAGEITWTSIAFLGGVSAATAMVIVETLALTIMVSNNVVLPLMVQLNRTNANYSPRIITIRRIIIVAILALSYVYYLAVGTTAALAQIGLMSFAAVAQFAPAFFGGMVWSKGTARGAMAGIIAGTAVWAYTLLFPSFADSGWVSPSFVLDGPFGIGALKPRAILGLQFDQLTHGVFWSLLFNVSVYFIGSLSHEPNLAESAQARGFLFGKRQPPPSTRSARWTPTVTRDELQETVIRYIGAERTKAAFATHYISRGIADDTTQLADIGALQFAEYLLSSVIGPASSRLVIGLLLEKHGKNSDAALSLLDDATTAVQQSRDLLQSAIDNVPQGIAVFDADDGLTFWNTPYSALVADVVHADKVGSSFGSILSELAPKKLKLNHLKSGAAPQTFSLENPFRVMSVQCRPMPDGGVVATFTDVTESVTAQKVLEQRVTERTAELSAANAALQDANINKTRFFAAASHDILQPLNAARLFTTTLMEREKNKPNAELARNVNSSLEAVEDILSTVLDLSRLDAGVVLPDVKPFLLQDILDVLQREFEPLASAKKLKLNIKPSKAVIASDRGLLRRVLQNLLANAIKYTPTGAVVLHSEKSGKLLKVFVEDTGPGIPLSKQKDVFREFERLGQEHGNQPGLGLGLSIVDRLCHVLGHTLVLNSQPGEGTTFVLSLPLSDAAPIVEVRPKRKSEPALSFANLKILAVDDEPSITTGLSLLLKEWGIETIVAHSTEDAKRKAQNDISLLIADYHVNDSNGIELITSLRSLIRADLPALIISADRSLDLREQARKRGIVWLTKPVKPAALRAAITQLANTQLANTQLANQKPAETLLQ